MNQWIDPYVGSYSLLRISVRWIGMHSFSEQPFHFLLTRATNTWLLLRTHRIALEFRPEILTTVIKWLTLSLSNRYPTDLLVHLTTPVCTCSKPSWVGLFVDIDRLTVDQVEKAVSNRKRGEAVGLVRMTTEVLEDTSDELLFELTRILRGSLDWCKSLIIIRKAEK